MFTCFDGNTADEVWRKAAEAFGQGSNARCQPSRSGATQELLHVGLTVHDPTQRWVVSRCPAINPAFALAEVVWIIAGRNDARFLTYWNRSLTKYAGAADCFHGAYGFRLRHHFGLDQMKRAYEALLSNPDSRQIVLQIWDPATDLPASDGRPQNADIPCNASALLKIRDSRLEWMQVIRSNDLFLGVPHNLIQFTSVQEVMAGWLNVGLGSYNQISDSLHVYDSDKAHIQGTAQLEVAPNTDAIGVDVAASEWAFSELSRRIEGMIKDGLAESGLVRLASWECAPSAFSNILDVLSAEAARRRRWHTLAAEFISRCTNPVYVQLWNRWLARVQKTA
jgi:thymidylate synthase